MTESHILDRIDAVLHQRRSERPEDSYTASLYQQGTPVILDKVREEAEEVVTAGATESDARLVSEVADLWFHCQVLLAHRELRVTEVFHELEQRFGKSGIVEKRERGGYP